MDSPQYLISDYDQLLQETHLKKEFKSSMIDTIQWRASIGSWTRSIGCILHKGSSSYLCLGNVQAVVMLATDAWTSAYFTLALLLILLCGDIETNPGPRPEAKDLCEALNDLASWDLFGIHLPGLTQADIEKIGCTPANIQKRKFELYKVWLEKCPLASWDDVIKALKTIGNVTLAFEVEKKYAGCQVDDEKQKMEEKVPDPPPVSSDDCIPMHEIKVKAGVYSEDFVKDINVIFLTVTNDEYGAVVAKTKEMMNKSPLTQIIENEVIFLIGTFASYRVAIMQTKSGQREILRLLPKLLKLIKAKYIVSIGMCYGMNQRKHKLGDVIVANKILDFTHKHIMEHTIDFEVDQHMVEGTILAMFRSPDGFVLKRSEHDFVSVNAGPIAAQPIVVKKEEYKEAIQRHAPYVLIGEMEGGAIVLATWSMDPKPEVIVIKGIADWGDGNKESSRKWQKFASHAAALFVYYRMQTEPNTLKKDKSSQSLSLIDPCQDNSDLFSDVIAELNTLCNNFSTLLSSVSNLVYSKEKVIKLRSLLLNEIARTSVENKEAKKHEKNLKSRTTFPDILDYLSIQKFVTYMNYELLKKFSDVCEDEEFESLIQNYQKKYKEVFNSINFSTFLKIIQCEPKFGPKSPVGLPTFQMSLTDAHGNVAQALSILDSRLSCAKYIQLENIFFGSIILCFSVYPIAARAVVKDLTNHQVLEQLKEHGIIDVKLSDELLLIGKTDADVISNCADKCISLKASFIEFTSSVEKILSNESMKHEVTGNAEKKICDLLCYRSKVIAEDVQHHVHKLKNASPKNMFQYLTDSHFVHYLNVHLVKEIFSKVDSIVKLTEDYSAEQDKFLDQMDFVILMEVFSTHDKLALKQISGLPKLFITLEDPFTNVNISRWNQNLSEQLKWSQHIFLTNVKKSSEHTHMIIEYSVLPIAVYDVKEELKKPKVLQYVGVTDVNTEELMKFEISCDLRPRLAMLHRPITTKQGTTASEIFDKYILQLVDCFVVDDKHSTWYYYYFHHLPLLINEAQHFKVFCYSVRDFLSQSLAPVERVMERFFDTLGNYVYKEDFKSLQIEISERLAEIKSAQSGKQSSKTDLKEIAAASAIFDKHLPKLLSLNVKHIDPFVFERFHWSFGLTSGRKYAKSVFKATLECVREDLLVAEDPVMLIDKFVGRMEFIMKNVFEFSRREYEPEMHRLLHQLKFEMKSSFSSKQVILSK